MPKEGKTCIWWNFLAGWRDTPDNKTKEMGKCFTG